MGGMVRRVVAGAAGLALGAGGLVFVAAPPAMAVGCDVSAIQYVDDFNTPTAVVTADTAIGGQTCSDALTVPADVSSVGLVLVGGGGGAGGSVTHGAGGGGGGFVDDGSVAVTPGASLGVTVGAGGAVGASGQPGSSGSNTTLTIGSTTYLGVGGGGGGSADDSGLPGGSGGGGGRFAGTQTVGGASTQPGSPGTGLGNAGVDGDVAYGGGGGGAVGSAIGQSGGGSLRGGLLGRKFGAGGNGAPTPSGSIPATPQDPGSGGTAYDPGPGGAIQFNGVDGSMEIWWVVSGPGIPSSVTASPGVGSATVSWTAPTTGGSPISEYVVSYSDDSGVTWVDDSTGTANTSYVVSGLQVGTDYQFRVRAVNDAHNALPALVPQGTASPWTAPVTPNPAPPTPTPPSAPTNVTATAGNAQASIVWGAPVSPGSFPVTNYRVTASPGGQTCLTSSTSCTITGLTNGTTYTFSASALSGAGWGASATSNPVTPSTDPAPTPAPGPQPLPTPLPPGASSLTVNGVPQQMTVTPNTGDNGLTIVSDDFDMSLDGLGPDGQPLDLGPDGVLVLDQERQAQSSGRGFLSQSDVDFYVDPPVATTGSSARSAGTYVGTLVTQSDGTFSGTITLPDTIEAGEHVLQAVGLTAQGQPRAVSIGVMVSAWIQLDRGTRAKAGRHDRITTTGSTAGIAAGTRLTPWIRYSGQDEFKTGTATITVSSDGSFKWTRLIRKDRSITAYISYTDIESNRVTWAKVR